MRVIVVRHYKTLNNAGGCIMGWGDSPRVRGWEGDLQAVNGILKKRGLKFDAIYSSSLKRARRTAQYYAAERGIKSLFHSAALNEVNYGNLLRKPKKWVKANVPEYKTDPDFVFHKGESFRQMQKRSVKFIISMSKRHRSETILVVVHAGVIRGLVSAFLELDFGANLKQKITHQYIGDFKIKKGRCVSYRELGKPSGFVTNGRVKNKKQSSR